MAVANVQPEYDDRTISAGFRAQRDSQTQTGSMQAANDNNPRSINRVERQYTAANDNYEPSSVPLVRRKMKVNHKKTPSKSSVLWARARLTAVNGWVIAWAVFWYLSFQLPLALISTTGLGMTAVVYDRISGVAGGTITDYALKALIDADSLISISTITEAAAKFVFGVSFNPMFIFIAPFAITFLLGAMQLILTWFIYSAAGIKSLSGKSGGIKILMFVFAGVGYAFPFLNLFPLIFLWMIMVWKYPK